MGMGVEVRDKIAKRAAKRNTKWYDCKFGNWYTIACTESFA